MKTDLSRNGGVFGIDKDALEGLLSQQYPGALPRGTRVVVRGTRGALLGHGADPDQTTMLMDGMEGVVLASLMQGTQGLVYVVALDDIASPAVTEASRLLAVDGRPAGESYGGGLIRAWEIAEGLEALEGRPRYEAIAELATLHARYRSDESAHLPPLEDRERIDAVERLAAFRRADRLARREPTGTAIAVYAICAEDGCGRDRAFFDDAGVGYCKRHGTERGLRPHGKI